MQLRVLSLNVWGLPEPFSRDLARRSEALADRLADAEADVIALQEVWTPEIRAALVAAGRRAHYDAVWHRASARTGSGLLVLSRLPIRSAAFHPFSLNGLPQRLHHSDYYSGKGFVLLQLDAPGAPVGFLDTHLHANYAGRAKQDEYRGHRCAQVVEIAAALARVRTPVIAVGDFNIREHDPEYRILTGLCGLVDGAVTLDRRLATVLPGNPYRGGGHLPGERIDYVLARDGADQQVRFRSLRRVLDERLDFDGRASTFSDHAGLLVDLELRAGPEAQDFTPTPEATELAKTLLHEGRELALRRRRQERMGAAGSALASMAGLAGARRSRRRLLRASLYGITGLGMLSAAGLLALSELFVPSELRAYDEVTRRLLELEASPRDPLR